MLTCPKAIAFTLLCRDVVTQPLADGDNLSRAGQYAGAQTWPPDRSGVAPETVLAHRDGIRPHGISSTGAPAIVWR